MKTEKQLNADILKITLLIQEKYPELSKYITEMPVSNPDTESDTAESAQPKTVKPKPKAAIDKVSKETLHLIASTISDLADENGWAFLGDVGNLVMKKQPNFDPRNFGFPKLTPFISSLSQFEIDKRETDKAGIKLVYIRNKE